MEHVNPVAEDVFERAREAFFGPANNTPRPSAPSPQFLEPRSEPRPREVTSSSSDKP
jgi:hypothetical protein